MTTITQALAEIRQRAEAATPGPWVKYITEDWPPGWIGIRGLQESDCLADTHVCVTGRYDHAEAMGDAEFILNTRTDVEKLAEALEVAVAFIGGSGPEGRGTFMHIQEILNTGEQG
jgi:hypothetical protein